MYRKVLIGGVTAAAILGAGGTALAVSGSDQATPTPSASSSSTTGAKHAGKHDGKHDGKGRKLLKHLAHGSFVVKGKDGTFETHDLILGTVTSVSSTSITVQAADKTSETFAVNKDTKVRVREAGSKGAAATITKVVKGDHVLVAGTGTSNYVAKHVIDVKAK